jgi:hypothetical protein
MFLREGGSLQMKMLTGISAAKEYEVSLVN